MYRIENKGAAIKVVQRYLGLAQSGVFDEKTRIAVKEFQLTRGLEASGIVDYNIFQLMRAEFFRESDKRAAAEIVGGAKFPIGYMDNGDYVRAVNFELSEVLKAYSYYGVPPRGSFYNSYTAEAVKRIREIFGLEIEDVIDEELYMRIRRERLTRV